MPMIDIHSHIIPFVDDGSSTIEQSLKMIDEAISQGITDIICTPHYRKNMFEAKNSDIKENFLAIKKAAQNRPINLYLGREIYLRKTEEFMDSINSDLALTLNNSKFVLLEFSYKDKTDISEIAYVVALRGYIPIIAHIERYSYVDIEEVREIKSGGALVQINASSVVGREGARLKKFVFALIKEGLVDFVASDVHENRQNLMNKAYNIVVKKFGLAHGQKLFRDNALAIISTE